MISLSQLKEMGTKTYIPKPPEKLDFDKLKKVPLPLRFTRSP